MIYTPHILYINPNVRYTRYHGGCWQRLDGDTGDWDDMPLGRILLPGMTQPPEGMEPSHFELFQPYHDRLQGHWHDGEELDAEVPNPNAPCLGLFLALSLQVRL